MTTLAMVEFECEGCGCTTSRCPAWTKIPRKRMARDAKKIGWHVIDNAWHCGRCSAIRGVS